MAVIITTDVGCVGEVFRPDIDCIVIPHNNKRALVEATLRVMNDKSLREKLKKNAYESITKHLMTKEEYLARMKESWEMALSV